MGLSKKERFMAMHQAKTEFGVVEGLPGGNPAITVFKGIPFAAPPVGALRWRPPKEPAPWDGVYKAYAFPPVCPQQLRSPGKPPAETPPPFEELNEDCRGFPKTSVLGKATLKFAVL
jgi:carboxylesterase type B